MSTEINNANEAAQSKKGGSAGKIIAAVLAGACLLASLGLNVYQALVPNQKVSEFIDHELERQAKEEEQENQYIEDGFKVGGEYEIRSTTHISDAYKSGDDSQLSEQDKKTLEMAVEVLDEVLEDGMSDYEKELAVYTWMAENIGHGSSGVISRPGMSRSAFTPYDVLSSKGAVCVGYATTFRLFMNMLGMECHIVHNEYHSWDLVQLDGDWYHVDIYSDAYGTLYGNFNMTDLICRQSHNWDESALPEADSVKYSPAVQNGVEMDSIYDIPAQFKKVIEDDTGSLFCKFKTPLTEEDETVVEFLVRTMDMAVDYLPEGSYYMSAAWFADEQGNDILGLFVRNYNGGNNSEGFDSSSEEAQKIIRLIAEAFELDPVSLGAEPEEGEDYPMEEPPVAADGPTQTVEVAASWNGSSSTATVVPDVR